MLPYNKLLFNYIACLVCTKKTQTFGETVSWWKLVKPVPDECNIHSHICTGFGCYLHSKMPSHIIITYIQSLLISMFLEECLNYQCPVGPTLLTFCIGKKVFVKVFVKQRLSFFLLQTLRNLGIFCWWYFHCSHPRTCSHSYRLPCDL